MTKCAFDVSRKNGRRNIVKTVVIQEPPDGALPSVGIARNGLQRRTAGGLVHSLQQIKGNFVESAVRRLVPRPLAAAEQFEGDGRHLDRIAKLVLDHGCNRLGVRTPFLSHVRTTNTGDRWRLARDIAHTSQCIRSAGS